MMARLMLSAGMLAAFASVTALRRRGFISGSPPPLRAAIIISLIMRVNAFPRLASVAAFLCLMVAHLECPDMVNSFGSRVASSVAGEPNTLEYHAWPMRPDPRSRAPMKTNFTRILDDLGIPYTLREY